MALLLGGAIMSAKEVFTYNRENYKFDLDQRMERETLRLGMQVKRFELFREDVRDLVKLTVDRMDVYHLVGAMFLQFCITILVKGRVEAAAPPFLLSLFLLSVACAFIYLLLAVWLSMHASIAAHSFGVRLLTRFVRLPIPSIKQLENLKFQYQDFEQQGLANVLRLPFVAQKVKQDWDSWGKIKEEDDKASKETEKKTEEETKEKRKKRGRAQSMEDKAPQASKSNTGRRRSVSMDEVNAGIDASSSEGSDVEDMDDDEAEDKFEEELLAQCEEAPIGGDDLLSGGQGAGPERHIQLFRRLQSKWQCYDAYCRVCMGLGVNQLLQALSYFAVCHTMVENQSPTVGLTLIVTLQCTTVSLAVLDLAGMRLREILAIQFIGMLPCFTATSFIGWARDEEGGLDPDYKYYFAPLSFLFQALWLELWLRIAMPSSQSTSLPRRFRQVLFLDVFNDAKGWNPLTDGARGATPGVFEKMPEEGQDQEGVEHERGADAPAEKISAQLMLVQNAMRRWKATPDWSLSTEQQTLLANLCKRLENSGEIIQGELDKMSSDGQGSFDQFEVQVFEPKLRRWTDLPEHLREGDPFANCLLGPFIHSGSYHESTYYFDLESQRSIFSDTPGAEGSEARVLALEKVAEFLEELEKMEKEFLEARILRDVKRAQLEHPLSDGLPNTKVGVVKAIAAENFPNLQQMMRMRRTSALFPSSEEVTAQLDLTLAGPGDEESPAQDTGGPSPSSSSGRSPMGTPARSGGLRDEMLRSAGASSTSPLTRIPLSPGSGRATANGNTATRQAPKTKEWDKTLVAMAGQDAKHFVPERLPWHMVSRVTRVLQVCWLYCGFMVLLDVLGIYTADFQRPEEPPDFCRKFPVFQEVEVQWPHGRLFNPQGMSCGGATGDLVVRSRYAAYTTRISGFEAEALREVERFPVPVTAMATLCATEALAGGSSTPASCVMATPAAGGIAFHQLGSKGLHQNVTQLRLVGAPWRQLAGAVVECSRVASLLPREKRSPPEWCHLLAGWDGQSHSLPIAVVPLYRGLVPTNDTIVRPSLDVPINATGMEKGVAALHVESREGRLSVFTGDGRLEMWDLFNFRRMGSWKLEWPASVGKFKPSAICGSVEEGLLFAGRSKTRGAVLVHAEIMFGFAGGYGDNFLSEYQAADTQTSPRNRSESLLQA